MRGASPSPPDEPGEASASLPRVLFVEDDEVFADVAIELLRPLAAVAWVSSAEEGLDALPREDWGLIIADVNLPGMSGLGFAREARDACPLAAILVLTASVSLDTAVAALRANADDFLTKPIDPPALLGKVAELIAVSGARKASSVRWSSRSAPIRMTWRSAVAGSCCATELAATPSTSSRSPAARRAGSARNESWSPSVPPNCSAHGCSPPSSPIPASASATAG